ncbi:flagellar filament capping protein FliD [Pseudomaricurvus sp.]|uniref:flagellar filament capping protein FliD n=1 Tax=Pseudomaricurvus sp. TaxID=2004510 RepID=UPI003F6BB858
MESIGGNIISSLGAGSGLNSTSLVEQLTDVERAPKQNQIDTKRESFETKLSDFGVIRSALSLLQDSGDVLTDSATFNSKSASFSDSSAFIPVSLDENVPVGNYSFEVLDVAQSQSLATGSSFAAPTDAVGKGSLTLDFGSWDSAEPPTTFTHNGDKDPLVITLDDTNNSLNGLRDAINEADVGVTASVVNDGNGYRLLLTAESGQSNQLQITATEEAGAEGLAAFNFNATDQALNQAQGGQDARLKINGLEVTRSTNEIDDVLDGFKFTLAKPDPGNVVNVSISEDKAGAQQAVRDFVDSFNAFLEAVEPAVGYNTETEEEGSLKRDPAARSVMTQIRNLISTSVGGLDESFAALSSVGIRTENDGTLSIDDEDFNRAFSDSYDQVKALFTPQASSSSDKIVVNSFRSEATPGEYDVVITQEPEKGGLVGSAAAGSLLSDLAVATSSGFYTGGASSFSVLDMSTQGVAAGTYTFDVEVDGGTAVTVELPIADYADETEIAVALQNEFDTLGVSADIVHNGSEFVVTSRNSGDSSSVAISNSSAEFGFSTGTATAGSGPANDSYNFQITVNGVTSNPIEVALGSYASQDELALYLQTQINNDSNLKAAGADVDVTWNGDHFEIGSRDYGSKSNVTVTALGVNAADLGLDSGVSTAGKNVAGTINGEAGFGSGEALLPALGSDAYGISLIVQPGATSSTVNFSRGFGTELSKVIDTYLVSNGVLDKSEERLEGKIEDLDDDQTKLDNRMEAYYERLLSQFMAMESIVNSINSSGSALDNIGDYLPFTSQNS